MTLQVPRRHGRLLAAALLLPCVVLAGIGAWIIHSGDQIARARQREDDARALPQ